MTHEDSWQNEYVSKYGNAGFDVMCKKKYGMVLALEECIV